MRSYVSDMLKTKRWDGKGVFRDGNFLLVIWSTIFHLPLDYEKSFKAFVIGSISVCHFHLWSSKQMGAAI